MEEFEISSGASSLNAHSASTGVGVGGNAITNSGFSNQAQNALTGPQGLIGAGAGQSSGSQQTGTNQGRGSDAGGNYCLSWCPNRCPAPMMVVGLGKEIGARVCRLKAFENQSSATLTNDYNHFRSLNMMDKIGGILASICQVTKRKSMMFVGHQVWGDLIN
jgi:hypothetical protein